MRSPAYLRLCCIAAIGISFIYQSCNKTDIQFPWKGNHGPGGHDIADNAMVLYWNNKAATVLGVPMRQPDRTRFFAIIEIAVHDALNNIKPKYETYVLNEPTPAASADAAVASAAYWAIKGLNLQASFAIDAWYDSSLAFIANNPAKEAGKTLGKHAADAILANRADDGYSQVIATSAEPANGTTPGAYRQTNAVPFRVIPNWGTVLKPYVVQSNVQFRPDGPYDVQSEKYTADYNEVKGKGAREGSTRTDEETELAVFWSENRISILWNDFAYRTITDKKMDAWQTARFFAVFHTAFGDGFNTVLESKYHFYYWRPESAIHEGDNDNNPGTAADAGWIPFVIEAINPTPPGNWVSPPVPEYPSSYAMAGGIAAEILRLTLGGDKISVDFTSSTLPGVTLHYNNLAKAARDNSIAKIYAGWYFRKAALDGEEMGKKIAFYVATHGFREK
jgi:hypothetical protein